MITKINALAFSLGGALLALSFRDDSRRSYWIGFINIVASWFIGYTLGEAVVEWHVLPPAMSNLVYVIASSIGLLLIGGLHRLAHSFFQDPTGFIEKLWGIIKRR